MYGSEHGIRASEGGIRAGLILTEANWASWYGKMKAGLLVNEILDIVDGTRVRPGQLPTAILYRWCGHESGCDRHDEESQS